MKEYHQKLIYNARWEFPAYLEKPLIVVKTGKSNEKYQILTNRIDIFSICKRSKILYKSI